MSYWKKQLKNHFKNLVNELFIRLPHSLKGEFEAWKHDDAGVDFENFVDLEAITHKNASETSRLYSICEKINEAYHLQQEVDQLFEDSSEIHTLRTVLKVK